MPKILGYLAPPVKSNSKQRYIYIYISQKGAPNILGFLAGGARYPKTFGRGARHPDIGMGSHVSYDVWHWGSKYSRIFGRDPVTSTLGCLSWGSKYPGIFGMGCQISYSQMGVPVFL